jgi:hypothetical protein
MTFEGQHCLDGVLRPLSSVGVWWHVDKIQATAMDKSLVLAHDFS